MTANDSERPWSDSGAAALTAIVDDLAAARRHVAAGQAAEARVLARAADLVAERIEGRRDSGRPVSDADLALREVSLELGMAVRVSDRTVQSRMGEAWSLVARFPTTLAAWETGRIDAGHAWAIGRAGITLRSDADRARFEALALDAAAAESAARFGPIARALASTIDPESAAEATAVARSDRRLRVFDLDDGMARLVADLPAPLAHAIADRITQLATAVRDGDERATDAARETAAAPLVCDGIGEPGESAPNDGRERILTGPAPSRRSALPRTLDQIRADLVSDMLLTGTPTAHGDGLDGITGRIQVTVPALTLAGVPGEPALLAGYGPVGAEFARRLAALAPGWDRVFTDPRTGVPVATDRYRPTASLRRFLSARDERCRTPTCTRPAHRCDIDHTVDAAHGGATEPGNTAAFCRRHHVGKHHTAWTVRQLGGGVLEWTSPLGHRYRDRPPAAVRFVPGATPAPTVGSPPAPPDRSAPF